MSYQHKDLAAGRWKRLSFVEQMANIGSEVERALRWRAKKNKRFFVHGYFLAKVFFMF
jgi:hypothetical protein